KGASRTNRTEWRLYYPGDFLRHANAGDLLVLARSEGEDVYGLVFQRGSSWSRCAELLFGIGEAKSQLQLIPEPALTTKDLEYSQERILEELEIEILPSTNPTDEDLVLETFGMTFPKSIELSEFARLHVDVDPRDADETLVKWIQRETELFFALERTVVSE